MRWYQFLQKTQGMSRRQCFALMNKGVVTCEGKVVVQFAQEVEEGDVLTWKDDKHKSHRVVVKSASLGSSDELVIFNKPRGYLVSKKDDFHKGETIYDILPAGWDKTHYYIGRLDKESHGLLLLTTNSALVNELESPSAGVEKVYHVRIDHPLRHRDRERMLQGVLADNNGRLLTERVAGSHKLSCKKVGFVKGDKTLLFMVLTEGKKRHIRRLCRALGYQVKDLSRVSVGEYELGRIKPGQYRVLKLKEV